ncbi:hypothetical protein KIN20_023034 [Parelaphostrongylus tenuis]|uniref:Uncharacterized protein n=1 Tax=Parelaphostrongylus tenuis TaxID=148309 RepID=A0AAD5MR37_PARTN|nr:hypothetical protein KIN20_023034 [Parelaphostrongylus tenuis]
MEMGNFVLKVSSCGNEFYGRTGDATQPIMLELHGVAVWPSVVANHHYNLIFLLNNFKIREFLWSFVAVQSLSLPSSVLLEDAFVATVTIRSKKGTFLSVSSSKTLKDNGANINEIFTHHSLVSLNPVLHREAQAAHNGMMWIPVPRNWLLYIYGVLNLCQIRFLLDDVKKRLDDCPRDLWERDHDLVLI